MDGVLGGKEELPGWWQRDLPVARTFKLLMSFPSFPGIGVLRSSMSLSAMRFICGKMGGGRVCG